MYIYAMRIWLLQDEFGMSFENASLYNYYLRDKCEKHILEFRSDIDMSVKGEYEKAYHELWEDFHTNVGGRGLLDDYWKKYKSKGLDRFKTPPSNMDVDYYGDGPEFSYL